MTLTNFEIKSVCVVCEVPFDSLAEKVPGWSYHYKCFHCKACHKVVEDEYLSDSSSPCNPIYCLSCGVGEFREESIENNPTHYYIKDRVRKVRHGKLIPLMGLKKKISSGLHLK
ncbi:uncharacterized protein LOC134852850 [Symsagittifera roscoffensis]|uniref:uncharacterized protein LOC134852850 n=1 Tax=Symsagittifera roscoffensis TaxID=84072 RepID=UPI00307BA075